MLVQFIYKEIVLPHLLIDILWLHLSNAAGAANLKCSLLAALLRLNPVSNS